MGKTIEQVILDQNKDDQIVLKITDENLHDLTTENLKKADVAIEFSTPYSAIENIYKCFDAGTPIGSVARRLRKCPPADEQPADGGEHA